jgi:hypothetical protein
VPRVYATSAQLADWLGLTEAPAGADRMLRAASLDVDRILLCAVYDVDQQGMPVDPDHVTAMQEATCAQAEYNRGRGDPYGVGAGRITQATIGRISVQRAASTGTSAPARDSPQAVEILRQAGLTGGEAWANR